MVSSESLSIYHVWFWGIGAGVEALVSLDAGKDGRGHFWRWENGTPDGIPHPSPGEEES